MGYDIINQLNQVKNSSRKLAACPTAQKNRALELIAKGLEQNSDEIIKENKLDIDNAKKTNLNTALIDRLTLTEKRIKEMASSVREIEKLPDPVGKVVTEWTITDGITIQKVRVPIGVICMIYESRPNVTVDSTALCLKSGNAVVLRGGKETLNSNRILVKVISQAIGKSGIPEGAVLFVDTPDRKVIYDIAAADEPMVDLVILRGGEKMIGDIQKKSTVPIITHGKGLCHTYIDKSADIDMAVKIACNAKVQRPGVCNAMETLLIHKDIAKDILPKLAGEYHKSGVELRGCEKTLKVLPDIKPATLEDWSAEYLDLILSIKIINTLDDAINHINKYGSGHSESIVAEDKTAADKFLKEIDASAVFHNASTRLHDGGVFGLGAEIGISTGKLHARGTMGLSELTTTKYVIHGSGQIRQ
jgi:glutamate-5-semialdehyde dehydrogenase